VRCFFLSFLFLRRHEEVVLFCGSCFCLLCGAVHHPWWLLQRLVSFRLASPRLFSCCGLSLWCRARFSFCPDCPRESAVHHDFSLPSFPLAVEWMDCPPEPVAAGQSATVGSYVAIGTMQPGIELWDLDVVDAMEPVAILGGEVMSDERACPASLCGSGVACVCWCWTAHDRTCRDRRSQHQTCVH